MESLDPNMNKNMWEMYFKSVNVKWEMEKLLEQRTKPFQVKAASLPTDYVLKIQNR